MTDPLRFPAPPDRERPFDLNEFADMAKEKLDGDDRRIVRRVGLDLVVEHGHFETFGDVLDTLASAGPRGRRELIDHARTALGMPTIGDEQFEARAAARNRALSWGPDAEGRQIAACAAEGCNVWATNPNGSLRPVADRRWWCPGHRDQAGPEDHLPEPPRYVLNENFALVPVGEELERLQAEDRERREEWEREEEAKRREGERLAKLRQAYEEETTISVAGVRVRLADGKIVPQ